MPKRQKKTQNFVFFANSLYFCTVFKKYFNIPYLFDAVVSRAHNSVFFYNVSITILKRFLQHFTTFKKRFCNDWQKCRLNLFLFVILKILHNSAKILL